MTTLTISEAAGRLGLSYSRVRQICKELNICPVNHIGNQPLYSLAQVRQMAKRNTKPGPKGNGR